MDFTSLTGHSQKVIQVVEALKNDPEFVTKFRQNPQEALTEIGVELNPDELAVVQKLGSYSQLEQEVEGAIGKIKGLFGFK